MQSEHLHEFHSEFVVSLYNFSLIYFDFTIFKSFLST